MRGKKAKEVHRYARKLMEMHPNVYKNRDKVVDAGVATRRIYPKSVQHFSGWRLAKLHARAGLRWERKLAG